MATTVTPKDMQQVAIIHSNMPSMFYPQTTRNLYRNQKQQGQLTAMNVRIGHQSPSMVVTRQEMLTKNDSNQSSNRVSIILQGPSRKNTNN